jgi:hypothetical protein
VTTFADSHQGDTIRLRRIIVRHNAHSESWALPLLLITEPAPCGGPWCEALRREALTPDGRWVHVHRAAWREIDVLEHGPASELATRSGDVLAEHVDKPSVGGGPELPADIEDEYRRGQNT